MSPSEMFQRLGAPLNNSRWSWGSIRSSDGVVFLRVWQDGLLKKNEKSYIWISSSTEPASSDLGANERLEHVNAVMRGSTCYLVMCVAEDTNAAPRKLKSFNKNEVFTTGELIEHGDSYWIEMQVRVNAQTVAAKKIIAGDA